MAGVADYSTTPASNTTINGIGIQGTNNVLNFDNAFRQLMADIASARADGQMASMPYATKAAGYTIAVTDRGKLVDCTAALELELPAAATAGAAFYFIAKANGGAVTLDPNGTEEINGSSTSATVADGSSAIVVCNGTAWFTITMIGGTNFVDTTTKIVGSSDATKAVRFEVDGITSGQTRVMTVPDADGTVVTTTSDAALTAGFTATADNDGTQSSGTYKPAPAGGNLKRIVNGGAFTLAAPDASGDYTIIVQITNNASAGAITPSGFSKFVGASSFTTTNGHDFMVFITKINGFTLGAVQALQ